jgi:hypothetical protein
VINCPMPPVTDKLDHIMLFPVHLAWVEFELTNFVVTSTDCIGSYKSNYHTITTMMTPKVINKLFSTSTYWVSKICLDKTTRCLSLWGQKKQAGIKLQYFCRYGDKNKNNQRTKLSIYILDTIELKSIIGSYDDVRLITQSIHIFGLVYYLSTFQNSPFYIRCYTYGKRSFVFIYRL